MFAVKHIAFSNSLLKPPKSPPLISFHRLVDHTKFTLSNFVVKLTKFHVVCCMMLLVAYSHKVFIKSCAVT